MGGGGVRVLLREVYVFTGYAMHQGEQARSISQLSVPTNAVFSQMDVRNNNISKISPNSNTLW